MDENHLKEKACKSCRKIKPVDDFYENKYSPDGRYAFCKICFDRFAQRLKEKEKSEIPLNKTCEKCGKVRLIDEFETDSDISSKENNWCKKCREAHADAKAQKKVTASPPKKPSRPPKVKKTKTEEPPRSKPEVPEDAVTLEPAVEQEPALEPEPAQESKPAEEPKPVSSPAPAPVETSLEGSHLEPEDDFDYIEYLLETKAFEEQAKLELLQVPKQITKIKVRTRVCNGCGKTEEIDQVEKNTMIPVHAWFCDFCRQMTTRRWVMKGMTIQDYWGREFKIKKIVSDGEVIGVLKNTNGKWEKRTQTIYGQWKTHKD